MDTPAENASDAELLARFASASSEAAFAEIVRRHSSLVLAVTRRKLGNSGFAEDAAQQVFIALARRAKQFKEMPSLPAWLQKAAVYEAASIARREARHRRRNLDAGTADSSSGPSRGEADLDQALASLSTPDRQMLLLHHFEKLRYEQIAKHLGISAAAAQRRGHRALERLASLLKQRKADEAACAAWLATGLAPLDTKVPADFVGQTLALKKPATFSLPWIPIAAALMIGGGVTAGTLLKNPPPGVTVATAATPPIAPRPETRKARTSVPDEQLADEFREFISRAKADSKDAWEWVKARPNGPEGFLDKAVRHLADRDLPAAERMLEVTDGQITRSKVICGVFYSRSEDNFQNAVAWIDSLPLADDRKAATYHGAAEFINSERDHDFLGALQIARTPEIRRWLIDSIYYQSRTLDENIIEKLAGQLEGDERRLARVYVASLRLQRNDPGGLDILAEIKAGDEDIANFPRMADLREFQPLCDWIVAQKDGVDRYSIASNLWKSWASQDAASAAAWAREINRKGGIGPYGMQLSPEDPVTKRLMKEEAP
ncbi:RNA polymerase sigma factor [Luteolibacter luteus]|uniref:Sigma-70 family RNA polymerase sigma factor n=1 Tax=Luteolibacter luteus TaxID=2728835 RepID=A0A858RJP7_9BACT|nr:sigma-70 family RNA polymerase sigma factor [Luteolibacter luteus]QJE96283.1 sigma-70 family RNA polymerase sigma factor [Luteolibacter luteus]